MVMTITAMPAWNVIRKAKNSMKVTANYACSGRHVTYVGPVEPAKR